MALKARETNGHRPTASEQEAEHSRVPLRVPSASIGHPWALDQAAGGSAEGHDSSHRQEPDASSPRAGSARARFLELARDFPAQVGLHIQVQRTVADLYKLSGWALLTTTGWASVAGGKLRLTNRAFDRLDRTDEIGGIWEPVGPGGAPLPEGLAPSYSSLRALAIGEVARLQTGSSDRTRYACGARVVEIAVEHTSDGDDTRIVLVRNVTDLANAEAELAEVQARLVQRERMHIVGDLALGIAHDLGNLLGALGLRTQVLQADPSCRAAQGTNIDAMERTLESARGLITRLQSIARPRDTTPRPVQLTSVLSSAIEIASMGFDSTTRMPRPMNIETHLPDLPPVMGSEEELRNVFINLLVNAQHAMPDGGRIDIIGTVEDGAVVVRIADNGKGIPEEDLPRIFEPFFSGKGSNGTGLGLALAKDTLSRMGGSITARNRSEGGACFELRFGQYHAPLVRLRGPF